MERCRKLMLKKLTCVFIALILATVFMFVRAFADTVPTDVHAAMEMDDAVEVFEIGEHSFYKISDDGKEIYYADRDDGANWKSVPSMYITGSSYNTSGEDYGMYIYNGNVYVVSLQHCEFDIPDDAWYFDHGHEKNATISVPVDSATNDKPTLSVGVNAYSSVGIHNDSKQEETMYSLDSAYRNVSYEVYVTESNNYQLKATVPMYICMFGYSGNGSVITPNSDAYKITNYSTVTENEKASISHITRLIKYTPIYDDDNANMKVVAVSYDETTGLYKFYSTLPASAPTDVEYTTVEAFFPELTIRANGNMSVVYTGTEWLFERTRNLKNGIQYDDVDEVTTDIPLEDDLTVHGRNFGKSFLVGSVGSVETEPKTKGLAVQISEVQAKASSWRPVEKSTEELKAGEIVISISPTANVKDKSALDLSTASSCIDVSDRGWNMDRPTVVNGVVTAATEFPIKTFAAIAGDNMNPEGCSPVVNICYKISPKFTKYAMLTGDSAVFTTASTMTFRSAAPKDEFEDVLVDGLSVPKDKYTVTEGSTIITFTDDYLAALKGGNHTIEIQSAKGSAECVFKKANNVLYYRLDGDTLYIRGTEEIGYTTTKPVITGIKHAVFEEDVCPLSIVSLFENCSLLEDIQNIEHLDTSQCTGLYRTFSGCSSLKELDVSGFETSKLTSLNQTFSGCSLLKTLDVSNWDTSNVTYMNGMFSNCTNLTLLDVSGFDTSNVTTLYCTFFNCSNLQMLDVSNWDISNVTTLYATFYNCSGLQTLDLSSWDTKNVTSLEYTFHGRNALSEIDVSNFDTSKVTNMQGTFESCSGLTVLDVSKWDVSNVTNMNGTFAGCSGLTVLDVSKWDTSNVTTLQKTFAFCNSVEELATSGWNTGNVTTMEFMCHDCTSLKNIDVSNWNTGRVTSLQSAFYNNKNLLELDVSKWDTGAVTTLEDTFLKCGSLKVLDVSNWNTENVTSLCSTFNQCKSLEELDLSKWDTSKVTTMKWTFHHCNSMSSIDVDKLNTSSVTDMEGTFGVCYALENLDISKWNVSNVSNMNEMFYSDILLNELDISGWNTSKVTDMQRMFQWCSKLDTVYVGLGWSVSQANTMDMFANCKTDHVTLKTT